jgi:hypothetical protein
MTKFGLFVVLLALAGTANAQKINRFVLTGAGLTNDAACPVKYDNCYILTIPSVDALGLTTTTFQKYASTTPNGFVFAAQLSMDIMVKNSYNGQAVAINGDIAPGFTHSSLLQAESCATGCTSAAAFTALTTTATQRFSGTEGPATPFYLAVLVAELNGVLSFTGADSAVVELTAFTGNDTAIDRVTIRVNQVSTALSFKLSYTAGTSTDYTVAFGNVNGLGLGGVTAPSAAPPGVVYYQPYTITPIFSNFNPANSTTVSAYVSTQFAPANAASTLHLCDAAAALATCSDLSLTSTSPTLLLNGVGSRSTNSRALGLRVNEVNGATAFPGAGSTATSATITYVITVK